MTTHHSIPSSMDRSGSNQHSAVHADRLTVGAAVTLLVISVLHTAAFAFHQWWGPWLAGPLRTEQLPMEAVAQFWGLPGGFVVPGVLLALLILQTGRRGHTMPAYVGVILGAWALTCVWIVGPSGFLLLLVPAVLLLVARGRARRRAP
ncbi:hypothetical protein [Microbacterium sp. H1-D42]|uniref:hypothetical protein n=1 Tax=Microbacterium sp. H1-D42 TaxID=2925844 RepID=UPI001F536F0C|nr:hypothetical protein [Microbacterium sp. H1-D42]UNK69860.1 hypothetical protein MNR00_11850 [Microbacterium sp. H1-D42]